MLVLAILLITVILEELFYNVFLLLGHCFDALKLKP